MKILNFLLLAGFLAFCPSLKAQPDKKTSLAVIEFYLPKPAEIEQKTRERRSDNPYFSSGTSSADIHAKLQKLQSFATGVFGEDSRFVLVERSALNLVAKERELQKSEDFIDGYVVSQGKNIGAEYLLTGDYELNSITLTLSLFSVAEQTTVAKEIIELQKPLFALGAPLRDPVVDGARRLSARVFPSLMTVVEATEVKKDKVKALLIAGGLKRGVKRGQVLDIKTREEREADGVLQTYYRTVGQAEVEKVEDDNFSIVAVKEGNEAIKTLLDSGKKLYCTFKL